MMDNRVNRVIGSKLSRDFTGFVARSIVYYDDLPIKAYAAQKPSCSFRLRPNRGLFVVSHYHDG
jgi:hypothetical protein